MKNLLFSILAGLMFSTSAMAIDECFSGSWYDTSSDDGRGIDFQVLPNDRAAGYFYTWYGEERELFLIVSEDSTGDSLSFSGYQSLYAGTGFVGTATIDVIDNNHMIFSHDWKYDHRNNGNTMHWCFTNCNATYEYTRLTKPIPCE
mgnify:CR=1 FL=1